AWLAAVLGDRSNGREAASNAIQTIARNVYAQQLDVAQFFEGFIRGHGAHETLIREFLTDFDTRNMQLGQESVSNETVNNSIAPKMRAIEDKILSDAASSFTDLDDAIADGKSFFSEGTLFIGNKDLGESAQNDLFSRGDYLEDIRNALAQVMPLVRQSLGEKSPFVKTLKQPNFHFLVFFEQILPLNVVAHAGRGKEKNALNVYINGADLMGLASEILNGASDEDRESARKALAGLVARELGRLDGQTSFDAQKLQEQLDPGSAEFQKQIARVRGISVPVGTAWEVAIGEERALSIFSPVSTRLASDHPNRGNIPEVLDSQGNLRVISSPEVVLPLIQDRLISRKIQIWNKDEKKPVLLAELPVLVDPALLKVLGLSEEEFSHVLVDLINLDREVNDFYGYYGVQEAIVFTLFERSPNALEISIGPNIIGFNAALSTSNFSPEERLDLFKLGAVRALRHMTLRDEKEILGPVYLQQAMYDQDQGEYTDGSRVDIINDSPRGIRMGLEGSSERDVNQRKLERKNTPRDRALLKALLSKRSAEEVWQLRSMLIGIYNRSSFYLSLLRNIAFFRSLREMVTFNRPTPGALKIPGIGLVQVYTSENISQRAVALQGVARHVLTLISPAEYENIPIQAVDPSVLPDNDLAHFDVEHGVILVDMDLYNQIKSDENAAMILRRHEYVENVVIPRLVEGTGLYLEDFSAHAVASAVDALMEGSNVHSLMTHVIKMMDDDQLAAIAPRHPNDPDGTFYQAVQIEISLREKGQVNTLTALLESVENEFARAYDAYRQNAPPMEENIDGLQSAIEIYRSELSVLRARISLQRLNAFPAHLLDSLSTRIGALRSQIESEYQDTGSWLARVGAERQRIELARAEESEQERPVIEVPSRQWEGSPADGERVAVPAAGRLITDLEDEFFGGPVTAQDLAQKTQEGLAAVKEMETYALKYRDAGKN
ncbi:MAG: hypothetical protein Q8Q33_03325, partial [Chlamydiota bacterium]|nr:hypothetical protein [Chlamydiota bacterium]